MIKLKQLMGIALFMAIMASCNSAKDKNGKTSSEKTETADSGSKSEEADAGKIINYTNAVIDVLKVYQETLVDAVKDYQEVENAMSDPSKREMDSYMHASTKLDLLTVRLSGMNVNMGPKKPSKVSIAFGQPTSALGKDKDFFADSVKMYKSLFDKLKANDNALNLYFKGKDYKDDKYAKGKDLINKQYALYDQLVALKRSINAKIEEVADAAEEISLKNDPLREAYIAAKVDLKKIQELTQYIDGIDNFTDNDIAKIDSYYNDILASIEAHKKIDRTELIKGNKNDAYSRFYTSLTEEMAELKGYIRVIKEKKKLTNSEYERINQVMQMLVRYYNNWVG